MILLHFTLILSYSALKTWLYGCADERNDSGHLCAQATVEMNVYWVRDLRKITACETEKPAKQSYLISFSKRLATWTTLEAGVTPASVSGKFETSGTCVTVDNCAASRLGRLTATSEKKMRWITTNPKAITIVRNPVRNILRSKDFSCVDYF